MDGEQREILERLRGIAENGGDLAAHKESIERLYLQVFGRSLRKCGCKNILRDAVIEIYSMLRVQQLPKNKSIMAGKAKLRKGVVVLHEGNHYTNANLTDDVARAFLSLFPHRKDWFEVLPSATTEKEVVAEVAETPENGAELASKSKKTQNKTITAKRKKVASKGK